MVVVCLVWVVFSIWFCLMLVCAVLCWFDLLVAFVLLLVTCAVRVSDLCGLFKCRCCLVFMLFVYSVGLFFGVLVFALLVLLLYVDYCWCLRSPGLSAFALFIVLSICFVFDPVSLLFVFVCFCGFVRV